MAAESKSSSSVWGSAMSTAEVAALAPLPTTGAREVGEPERGADENARAADDTDTADDTDMAGDTDNASRVSARRWRSMTASQIARYSRHMLMPAFGRPSQEKLLSKTFLCIGAGGLGSTVIMYLAAAGVGRLIIVDNDHVDTSNLHRQVVHRDATNGKPKALSAKQAALELNPSLECVAVVERFTVDNAEVLVKAADVVLDATDNLTARYLINDACVLFGKPLVSGAAVGFDGQLTVYNHDGGPCYRCINPVPPPPSGGCSDVGVLGPVPGLIGCFQAIEAIKVAAGIGTTMSQRMLVFDALDARSRIIRLRGRVPSCKVCGDLPLITSLAQSGAEVHATCLDASYPTDTEAGVTSVSAKQYLKVITSGQRHVLLDVRRKVQYGICKLPGSVNVPLAELARKLATIVSMARPEGVSESNRGGAKDDSGAGVLGAGADPRAAVDDASQPGGGAVTDADGAGPSTSRHTSEDGAPTRDAAPDATSLPVYVICRRGIDSVMAAKLLQDSGRFGTVRNVAGGLQAWAAEVDDSFPTY